MCGEIKIFENDNNNYKYIHQEIKGKLITSEESFLTIHFRIYFVFSCSEYNIKD
jgi:hypothetical protein